MGKNIFSVLIIAGLCFGQGIWLKENPKINLPMPINGAIGSTNGTDGIAERKVSFYSSQNLSLIKSLGPNVLFMQVAGESLQPRTPFWKRAGIYGLEFMAGGVGSCASLYLSWLPWPPEKIPSGGEDIMPRLIGQGIYIVSNPLLTSGFTVFVAKMFNQNGSWKKALIGSSLGTITSFIANTVYYQRASSEKDWVNFMFFTPITLPPTGGVVGYNW